MKFITVLPIVGLFMTAVACSGGGGGNGGGERNLAKVSHKPEECPEFNGEYTQNGGAQSKIFKTEKTSVGLNFEDSGVKYIIDGSIHSAESNAQLSYRGSCEGYSIILDLYRGSSQLARMAYSWSDKAQVVIDTTVLDSQFRERETWDPQ